MTPPQHATGSSSGATSSPLSTTLRSRSLSSKQNIHKQTSTEIKNDEIQQQQQLRNNTKIRHRFKAKILLLVPAVLLAVSSIIGLSIGHIVSDLCTEKDLASVLVVLMYENELFV
jgi:hypothetical protein